MLLIIKLSIESNTIGNFIIQSLRLQTLTYKCVFVRVGKSSINNSGIDMTCVFRGVPGGMLRLCKKQIFELIILILKTATEQFWFFCSDENLLPRFTFKEQYVIFLHRWWNLNVCVLYKCWTGCVVATLGCSEQSFLISRSILYNAVKHSCKDE